mmetsp:Transcript_79561/g.155696  ORF Transcript_79561/g.155696 Transcript_79561/m.155696 type:complete len:107 (+) Transcript_79561:233-553(+)
MQPLHSSSCTSFLSHCKDSSISLYIMAMSMTFLLGAAGRWIAPVAIRFTNKVGTVFQTRTAGVVPRELDASPREVLLLLLGGGTQVILAGLEKKFLPPKREDAVFL